MKTILSILLFAICNVVQSQTVAEKPEFVKFMNYCQCPIEVTAHMAGMVSLVKYNSDFTYPILYWKQPVTGDWMAKYPLVIKWYPVSQLSGIVEESYQQSITAYFKIKVPRVYCTSKTAYLALFRTHWKNGDMQSGWHDAHYLPMTVRF